MPDGSRDGPGRKRYIVYGLLFTMTLINYFDRTVLSVAMPVLIAQFALTPVAVGYLLSAFIWSYAPCQLPAGMTLDRWGTRSTAARCIAFWSAATALTGAATSFAFVFFTPAFKWAPCSLRNQSRPFCVSPPFGSLSTADA